jgi:flagellar hook assembly protein FlgD
MKIYSVLGEEVTTLVSEHRSAGDYTVVWHAQDGNGLPVPSGVYFVRMTAAGREGRVFTATRKLVLMR